MNLPDEVIGQLDGANGNNGFYHTAEQWDQFEELFGKDEDDVLDEDGAEFSSLLQ